MQSPDRLHSTTAGSSIFMSDTGECIACGLPLSALKSRLRTVDSRVRDEIQTRDDLTAIDRQAHDT